MDRRVIVLILCGFCFSLSGASTCVANSEFKMDCNSCVCSPDGKQYTCTSYKCSPKKYDNFYLTETKDGHVLLVPKTDPNFKVGNDEGLNKPRKVRIPEEIEDVDNSEQLDVEEIQPNDSDEQEQSDFIDTVDDQIESNEINQGKWKRFTPRPSLKFPE
ncbi:uncharacterized protein LOC130892613 [Diorhabda carinulata]|uniref:uncharacterized protein LOC130892613 n=1 Tax=Diorhabda carinulata TaxID=1163345 RepID=UPI0025A0FD95|nr:uncharacterized protein LOC130892613 [Diorhabda carinulata]